MAATTLRLMLALVVLVGSTCAGGPGLIRVEESAETTVESGTVLESVLGELGLAGFVAMDVTANRELENRGVQAHQIDSVVLEDLSMTITSPRDGDFSFIQSIEFHVAAPGLETRRVAFGGPFAAGESHVLLAIDPVELEPYVVSQSMTVSTVVKASRPEQQTQIRVDLGLLVDVDFAGLLCGPS